MTDSADSDGEDLPSIRPTLINELRNVLDEYPDDGQILKVGRLESRVSASSLGSARLFYACILACAARVCVVCSGKFTCSVCWPRSESSVRFHYWHLTVIFSVSDDQMLPVRHEMILALFLCSSLMPRCYLLQEIIQFLSLFLSSSLTPRCYLL